MSCGADIYARSPEATIVRLAVSGDDRAFEELVRRRQSWIRNLLRRLSRDPTLADDLAQQTFLQVWQRIDQLRDAAAFPGWLKRTAVNTWLQHLRARGALDDAASLEEAPETAVRDASGAGIDLDSALALLPPQVRLCIVLAYHERLSHAEIAEVAALPLGTVKSHIRRGTERLRQWLAAYEDEDATSLEVRQHGP